MADKKLRSMGEFGLIRRIQEQAGSAAHLVKGIGDDCAVQRQEPGRELLTSTDLLIEGIHFDRRWISMEQLGRKAVAVNISDIAAMGGVPRSLLLGVACSTKVSDRDLQEFIAGFLAEAQSYSVVLAGGDTSRSPGPLMISVTVLGEVEKGQAICRSGAAPGEAIYVSGTLGGSALALHQLQQGEQPSEELARQHHTPKAQVALGRLLAQRQLATAMLDISDGLLADLGHIAEDSGVGAELQLAALPLCPEFVVALEQNPQLIDLALSGGEDYQLLLTAKEQRLDQQPELAGLLTRIGTITQGTEVIVKRADQTRYRCARGGFDHFV